MKTSILMVCLGNICRSPLAEGILAEKLDPNRFFIDSAGTSGLHAGELPDRRSIAVAQKHGIDLSNQRSRKFVLSDFEKFNYIYVMDRSNYNNVVAMTNNPDYIQKVEQILNVCTPNENLEVPDPYYGGDQGFDNVYNMLDEACTIIANKLTP